MSAAERREARKHWRGRVVRSWDEADRHDVLFWDAIPIDDRARVTWELSRELIRIAYPDIDEPRLSRSVVRIIGR